MLKRENSRSSNSQPFSPPWDVKNVQILTDIPTSYQTLTDITGSSIFEMTLVRLFSQTPGHSCLIHCFLLVFATCLSPSFKSYGGVLYRVIEDRGM